MSDDNRFERDEREEVEDEEEEDDDDDILVEGRADDDDIDVDDEDDDNDCLNESFSRSRSATILRVCSLLTREEMVSAAKNCSGPITNFEKSSVSCVGYMSVNPPMTVGGGFRCFFVLDDLSLLLRSSSESPPLLVFVTDDDDDSCFVCVVELVTGVRSRFGLDEVVLFVLGVLPVDDVVVPLLALFVLLLLPLLLFEFPPFVLEFVVVEFITGLCVAAFKASLTVPDSFP